MALYAENSSVQSMKQFWKQGGNARETAKPCMYHLLKSHILTQEWGEGQ